MNGSESDPAHFEDTWTAFLRKELLAKAKDASLAEVSISFLGLCITVVIALGGAGAFVFQWYQQSRFDAQRSLDERATHLEEMERDSMQFYRDTLAEWSRQNFETLCAAAGGKLNFSQQTCVFPGRGEVPYAKPFPLGVVGADASDPLASKPLTQICSRFGGSYDEVRRTCTISLEGTELEFAARNVKSLHTAAAPSTPAAHKP
ncbi:MAG: hypothetical protein U0002_21720 [Thermoanaerobaculia bacterium]